MIENFGVSSFQNWVHFCSKSCSVAVRLAAIVRGRIGGERLANEDSNRNTAISLKILVSSFSTIDGGNGLF